MGYSEIPCHLCGVRFNIGRIRTREEPRTHAWTESGYWNDTKSPAGSSWVESLRDWTTGNCFTEKTGCYLLYRGGKNSVYVSSVIEVHDVEQILNVSEGEDWVPKVDDEEDTMEDESVAEEWDSEAEAVDGDKEDHQDVDLMELDDDDDDDDNITYAAFINTFQTRPVDEAKEDFINFPDPNSLNAHDFFSGKIMDEYEHIAGPGCMILRGYNGHRISALEMSGCKTVQCLISKESHWQQESDDLEFEHGSRYFLTGLTDFMPSRDNYHPNFVPHRHGLKLANVDVHDWMERPIGMPFHPWCFEIFIRQSRQRFGHIDADGLMDWRNYQHSVAERHRQGPMYTEPDAFDCIPRHPDVAKSRRQSWYHLPGNEYLVANPVLVPELPNILSAAIEPSPSLQGQNGVFNLTKDDILRVQRLNHHDPFLHLSSELRLAILELLDGTSIASLRLSSHAFRQLPQSIFYTLIRRELPSLWEAAQNAEGDPTPYFWTQFTARKIEMYIPSLESPAHTEFLNDITLYRKVIREEMPELYDDWVDAEPSYREFRNALPWSPEVSEQLRLSKGLVNWHRLYVNIKQGLKEGRLKGLKNRERIWKDVEFIINKIAECREQGHIP